MARIRTIKPEFFTSEDIVSLSPLARLLYIALWCEADKEGRMVWKPMTFKLRYLPGDNCNVHELCQEIVDRGLVTLYGDGFAVIPAFAWHQHINPRESESVLPDPAEKQVVATRQPRVATRQPRVATRQPRDPDAQVGREGKGKERKCVCDTHHTQISEEFRTAIRHRPELDADLVFANFSDHYPSEKRTLTRWKQWVKNERGPAQSGDGAPSVNDPDSRASIETLGLSVGVGKWDELKESWAAYKTRILAFREAA